MCHMIFILTFVIQRLILKVIDCSKQQDAPYQILQPCHLGKKYFDRNLCVQIFYIKISFIPREGPI